MKYVMINGIPIIFSEAHRHSQFQYMGEITSAGFVKIVSGKVNIYGQSVSLKMCPDPYDEEILNKLLFNA